MSVGVLHGVGVGPGDPELLTVKAVRCLESCPVIAYPAPPEGPSLARRIAAPYLDGRDKIEIAVRIPLAAGRFTAPEVYAAAQREIIAHLDAGRDAAVLCLGDPFLYGSFIYIFQGMAAGYPVRVIPGVSAVTAAASAAGAPLAVRDETLSIVPATLNEEDLAARITAADAVAVIKVGGHLAKLKRVLQRLGLDEQATYIERATFNDERRLPLAEADPAQASYFSIVLTRRQSLL